MSKFETTFFEYFNNIVRYLRTQPLNLGGYAAPSGGLGGPPGGFVGYLPQTRVTYDETEAATLDVPESGSSLLDNLNHIRYRLGVVEGVFEPGIVVSDNDVVVGSGITVLNFENADVEYVFPNKVNVTITTELNDKFMPSGLYGDNLSDQIGASGGNHFYVNYPPIYDDSLRVFYNGVRQGPYYYTMDSDKDGFTTTFTVSSGDTLFVDYDILVNDTARVITSGVSITYLEDNYYDKTDVDGFLAAKADLVHTHTESQITDLSHDADYIKGTIVATGTPLTGQALVFDGFSYTPTTISTSVKTIHQQYIFTVEGLSSDAGTGTKPLRIYAHELNGDATFEEIFLSLNTAPASSGVQVDILKNGSTIFQAPEYVEVSTGNNTGVRNSNFAETTFTKDDYFQIELVQTDTTASDLSVHIRFYWETD